MKFAIVVGFGQEAEIVGHPDNAVVIVGAGNTTKLASELQAAIDGGCDHVLSVGTCGALDPALKAGDVIIKIDPRYYRPTEVETLLGDPSKAKVKLGWVPEITIDEMIVEMVANDLDQAKQHALLKKHGFSVAIGKEN